jgi:hypothetical protein
MNWGGLKTMAAVYTHRTALDYDSAQIPACDRLSQVLDVQDNEAVSSGTLPTTPDARGLYSLALPPDYARMKSVTIGGDPYYGTSLINLQTDLPDFEYAVSGNQLWATASGTASYSYGKIIQPIVGDTNTSIILTRFPRLYLYAVVIEAFIQVQDFDGASGYQTAFADALDDANSLQAFARYDAGSRPKTAFARF